MQAYTPLALAETLSVEWLPSAHQRMQSIPWSVLTPGHDESQVQLPSNIIIVYLIKIIQCIGFKLPTRTWCKSCSILDGRGSWRWSLRSSSVLASSVCTKLIVQVSVHNSHIHPGFLKETLTPMYVPFPTQFRELCWYSPASTAQDGQETQDGVWMRDIACYVQLQCRFWMKCLPIPSIDECLLQNGDIFSSQCNRSSFTLCDVQKM